MKKWIRFAVCTAVLLLCPGRVSASPSETGALHVEGTRLVGSNGETVQLKGISTHGIAWFPDYINEDCFEQLHREWNADVIRIAMYTAESGGYCTDGDQEYLKRLVCDGVDYAGDQDMYAIIDWHILSDADPNIYKNEAKEFFREMSEKYRDSDHVLYEICNEPNGNTGWTDIKAYAEEIIEVIRSNDKDAVILVGTPNWSQFVDQAAADPIEGYDNLMYTLHFYAATHQDDLRNKMASAVEAGLPIFVSEYGICDASGSGAIDEEQANQWVETMNQYGISYVAWNLSNKEETSAILESSCGKVSGFTAEDLSESGQWLYRMLNGKQAGEAGTLTETEWAAQEAAPDLEPETEGKSEPETGLASDAKAETALVGSEGSFLITDQDFRMEISAVNSWETDGKRFCQYQMELKNNADRECIQWAVDVPFEKKIALSDGWNGTYSLEGNVLHIASMDYNGEIPAGETITDIGFIVSFE